MDRSRARASRGAPQTIGLARIINEGGFKESHDWGDRAIPVDQWFLSFQTESRIIGEGMAGPQIGPDWQSENIFSQCARLMYRILVILPTHPDYPMIATSPLARTEVDTVSRFYGPSDVSLHPPLCDP